MNCAKYDCTYNSAYKILAEEPGIALDKNDMIKHIFLIKN